MDGQFDRAVRQVRAVLTIQALWRRLPQGKYRPRGGYADGAMQAGEIFVEYGHFFPKLINMISF